MNTHLITDAVRNSRAQEEASIWDRLFAFWFRRLVYTQIWEDPEADLAALKLARGATIVTISSGGCNALSYLSAKPAQVYAVDLNEAHLSLLKLKLAGLRALPNYASFWQFFGEGASPANATLYNLRLRPALDNDARSYWDERDISGRPRSHYFTNGFYRHGALGRFIGFAHKLAKIFRIDLAALLQDDAHSPARQAAMQRLHGLFHSRFARMVTRMPALLFSLGIPPQQRKLLGGDQPLNEVLHQRLMALIDVHPNKTNYFAWQALARRYVGPGDSCLPLYLQQSRFAEMQKGAGLVTPVHANLRVFLEAQPARQVNAVVLLDSQDWMAPDEIRALWNAIDRAGQRRPRDLPHRRHRIAAGRHRTVVAERRLAAGRRGERERSGGGPFRHLRRFPFVQAPHRILIGLLAPTGLAAGIEFV